MGCNSSAGPTENLVLEKETVDLIQDSWKKFLEVNTLPEHGTNLVIRLFTSHTEIRHIWKFADQLKTEEDMRTNGRLKYHGKRLMETLGVCVRSLNTLEVLDVLLLELGARHFSYGTQPEHFGYVKDTFFYVFSQAIGSNFTPEVANAWDLIFQYILKKMLEGMKETAAMK